SLTLHHPFYLIQFSPLLQLPFTPSDRLVGEKEFLDMLFMSVFMEYLMFSGIFRCLSPWFFYLLSLLKKEFKTLTI
ncbi:MAG: hypothetical protein ACTSRR_13215, partial [Candidatus Heimdallarchaeaceae archaeon]